MFISENIRRPLLLAFGIFLALGAAGCSSTHSEAKYPGPNRDEQAAANDIYAQPDTVFGKGGGIFGAMGKKDDSSSSGIGVNSFLWRASLDTVAFMPLASADPFGGVILTDWYSPPETPGDRFKMNVLILGRQLRSDGVQVKVFKQSQKGGAWHDVAVPADMGRKVEDSILTRARQMRVAQMGNG
jgi:hypothetical protein